MSIDSRNFDYFTACGEFATVEIEIPSYQLEPIRKAQQATVHRTGKLFTGQEQDDYTNICQAIRSTSHLLITFIIRNIPNSSSRDVSTWVGGGSTL